MHHVRLLALFFVALLVAAGSPLLSHGATSQHQATPPPVTFPVTPPPEACTVEPRALESFLALLGTPEADQVAEDGAQETEEPVVSVPVGRPVDRKVRDAIAATVHELYACFNAGDVRRAFALVSDTYLRDLTVEQSLTPADVGFFMAEPAPVPIESRTTLLAITDVSVLPGGRVGAFVVAAQPLAGTETVYTIFYQQNGQWVVDEIIEFL